MTDHLFDLPVERLDNPPMPWKQYRNMMFREWARKAAIVISCVLFGCAVAALMNALKWGW